MRLEQLQHLIEIKNHGSVSKAAKALYVSQPALSASLTSLEEELGIRLFERSASGVIPTPAGKDILHLAEGVLEQCLLIQNYGEQNKELYGTVTLYIAEAFSPCFSDLIILFKERYPKANLILKTAMPHVILDALKQGDTHIAALLWGMVSNQSIANLQEWNIHYESFGTHQIMLCVGKTSRFAEEKEITVDRLIGETFLTYDDSTLEMVKNQLQIQLEPLIVHDRETLKQMVSRNNGIAIVPDTFLINDIYYENDLIRFIPIVGPATFQPAESYLLYSQKVQLTELEKGTLEILRVLFEKMNHQ